jgi:hypothetical protein
MTNKHADMVSCLSSFFFMGALYNYWWSQHCLCGLAYTPATMSGKISKQGDILYHLAREASPARNAAMRILRRGGWYHAPVVPVLTSILYAAHVVVAVISRKHLWNHAPVRGRPRVRWCDMPCMEERVVRPSHQLTFFSRHFEWEDFKSTLA